MAIKLRAAAEAQSQSHLVKGYLDCITDRGADQLTAKISHVSFEGTKYEQQLLFEESTHNTVYDGYSDNIVQGEGSTERVEMRTSALAADAITATRNRVALSQYIKQKALAQANAASKIGRDFNYNAVNGAYLTVSSDGDVGFCGFEGWLTFYGGQYNPGTAPSTPSRFNRTAGAPIYYRQKMWGTTTGRVDGTALPLNDAMLRAVRTGNLGMPHEVWYCDESTYSEVESILAALPGNAATMHMDQDFGREMFGFNGMPIVILDAAGAPKVSTGAAVSSGSAAVTIPLADDAKWIGFTDLDLYRPVTFDDGDSTTFTSTIIAVGSDGRSCTLADNAPATFEAGDTFTVHRTKVLYAARFSPTNGFHAIYHKLDGPQGNTGERYSSILGFEVHEIGRMEAGRKEMTQFTYFGGFYLRKPYALRRLSHYRLAVNTTYFFYQPD